MFRLIKARTRRRSGYRAYHRHQTDGIWPLLVSLRHHRDAANAILSAVGFNLRLVLKWLRIFLSQILDAIFLSLNSFAALNQAF